MKGDNLLNNSKFKLEVFISSAMGEESGTKWLEIRKSIKNTLCKCEFLSPFTIEDHANEIPSTQFFTWWIKRADVVVILVKNEIRPGTQQEIDIAIEKGIPILVYFCNTEEIAQSAKEFKNYMISKDKTTFKLLDSFIDIDKIVFNDIVNNLISYYKYTHDVAVQNGESNYYPNELVFEDNILDKSLLSYFGSNQNILFELFSLSFYGTREESNNSKLGKDLLEWLYGGEAWVSWEDLIPIWEKGSLAESIINILKLRHQSIQKYFDKNYTSALEDLDGALKLAKEKNAPDWLLGDMLIDARNISSRMKTDNLKYKEQINEMKKFIHFPVGDRYLKNAFETLERERLEIRTLSASDTRLGNTLTSSLQDLENYLYISLLIGSSTHLLLARKKFIEILLEYGDLYGDENLIYQSLRLMVLAGESKMFSRVLQKYWEEINATLAVKVDELWELTNRCYSINNKIMKCLIIKSLGQYMENSLFRKAMTFLLDFSENISSPQESKYILNAMNNNLTRLKDGFSLDILLNVLKSNKINLYGEFTNILSNLDLARYDRVEIEELSNELKNKIDIILGKNGQPYFIINLLNQCEESFIDLYDMMSNLVLEEDLDYIDIELGNTKKAEKTLI
ncbi:hypothetical protein GZ782_002766, partial [Enterococcus faecalis]|nr:hypothetical protein [Enterococcus faecalis]